MDRNSMTEAHAWALLDEINRLSSFLHPISLSSQMQYELENDIERWKLILEDAGYSLVFSDEIRRYVFTQTPGAETPGERATLEAVPLFLAVKPAMHELEELVEQSKEFEQKYQRIVKQLALMSREERSLTLERLNTRWGGK